MTILLEAAEISRFPSPEDFASYCRTVAAIKTSNGKKKAQPQVWQSLFGLGLY
jgi:Transposase IS116/IS110/IS902 family